MLKVRYVILFVSIFSWTGVAGADGFYFGGGMGKANTEMPSMVLTVESDTALQLIGGYFLNENMSVEIQYVNIGEVETPTLSTKINGYNLSILGFLPLDGNVSIFSKIGYANMASKWTSKSGGGVGFSSSQTRNDLSWGVGAQLDYSPTTSIRLSFDSYDTGTEVKGTSNSILLTALIKI